MKKSSRDTGTFSIEQVVEACTGDTALLDDIARVEGWEE